MQPEAGQRVEAARRARTYGIAPAPEPEPIHGIDDDTAANQVRHALTRLQPDPEAPAPRRVPEQPTDPLQQDPLQEEVRVSVEHHPRHRDYQCPITMEVFRVPVVAADGETYEEYAIMEHMRLATEGGSLILGYLFRFILFRFLIL